MLRKILTKLHQANILLHRYSYTNPTMEIVYRELLLRELARANVADVFYPVGGGANHSFMYVIARIMNEFDIHNVVELGAGQTSILLDRMRKATGRECTIRTIEHDAFWVDRIRSQVEHLVIHAPLRPAVADGVAIPYYDADSVVIGADVHLAIVDGPPASNPANRHARLGAFDLLKDSLAPDCVLVIDDWERAGEMRLARMFENHFRSHNFDYTMNTLRADKSQAILAAGKFRHAAYF
ncbi:MAG: hypothetical protein KGJ79_10255 [Alphaproteobacteria bacterium]|nr:hypothetical protein [Alphaproteobacteria bacterium]MDE2111512.1 hypothetical protein [Alphaproteobacteria bacterium]MDE2493943.1 hypothetical protein [Alphaproteobacteria bacterium]